MAFTTLEQRFNESAKNIYSRFSNTAELVTEIKPDSKASKTRIKDDTRGLPVVSTGRELTRVSKFLSSNDGRVFITTQGVLNTQSTFKTTIPISVKSLGEIFTNFVPFGFLSSITRTTSLSNGIQFKTLAELANPTPEGAANPVILTPSRISPPGDNNIDPTIKIDSRNTLFTFASDGNSISSYYARPEDVNGWYPSVLDKQSPTEMSSPRPSRLYKKEEVTNRFINSSYQGLRTLKISTVRYGDDQYWQDAFTKYVKSSIVFNLLESVNQTLGLLSNAGYIGNGSTYADSYNISNAETNKRVIDPEKNSTGTFFNLYKNEITYDYITGTPGPIATIDNVMVVNSDIIKFIFTDADGMNPIHFRAFISSIKEQVKPEFSEQRYVGRIERFVTYSGVKRSLSLQFNIVAFSAAELRNMWLRVNSLTGRAFPKGFSYSGFMAPPLFKITIGNLYDNQPCYIDSLDYDFLDESITFDVDAEVPRVINVSLSLTLMEKRTKKYNSPFYAITEAMQGKKDRGQVVGVSSGAPADAGPTPAAADAPLTPASTGGAPAGPPPGPATGPTGGTPPPVSGPSPRTQGGAPTPGGTTGRPSGTAGASVNARQQRAAAASRVALEPELNDALIDVLLVPEPGRTTPGTVPNRTVNPNVGDRPINPFQLWNIADAKQLLKSSFASDRPQIQAGRPVRPFNPAPINFGIPSDILLFRPRVPVDPRTGQPFPTIRADIRSRVALSSYVIPRTLTDGTQILSDGTIIPPDKFGRPQAYRRVFIPGVGPRIETIKTDGGLPLPPSVRRGIPARAVRPVRVGR